MQLIQRLFRDHPESVGETYLEHLFQASYFGRRMVVVGFACLVHALIPCLFKTTGRTRYLNFIRKWYCTEQNRTTKAS